MLNILIKKTSRALLVVTSCALLSGCACTRACYDTCDTCCDAAIGVVELAALIIIAACD